RVLEENAWRSSPPIVSAGVVLLASPAHPNLLAFSAATGRRRWSTPIDRGASLIGADLKQVWVSGRSVASLSLLDGELIWKRELPSPPTGRAVVCGDRILAPTVDGLVTIAAGTGEVLAHDSIPDGSEPLGNAVCHGAALYVVGPASVRKFPDLVRSFKVARLAYERAPTDAMAAMRLAWLHLFTEEPQQAVAVLSSLHDEPAGGDPVRADRVAHVRVEALLALARRATSDPAVASDESPPPDVLALLQRAEQTARSPGDRLRSGLAIADHLAASGKAEVACGRLWELGLDSMGDQIVPIGDHVVGPARLQIARQLEAVVAGLDEDQRRRIRALETKRAQATLDKLLGRESTGDKSPVTGDAPPDGARYTPTARQARLRAIGALAPFSAVGQRALLSLAGESERALHFEQAELLYREAARWNADPELTLAGLTRLGEMYLASNRLGVVMDDMLLGVLDAIESQYASAALPATGRTDTPPVPSRTTEVNPADSAADSALNWVHRIRSEVPESTRKAHRLTRSDAPVRLTGVAGWSISWDQQRDAPQRLVSFGPSLPEVLWDRVVVRNMDDVISCYAADSGELVWQAVLRAPESFPATPQRSQRPRRTSQRRYAVADGQTGVFSAASGLFAVGLATGRRLWMRPYHLAGEVRAPANRDLLMAAGDGFLAATPNAGRLTLMRLEDGTTVWERDLRNDTVDRIQMEGNRIMASSARRELTLILDRAGGELLQRVAWDQPDPEHDVVDLVIESQVLSGPKSWAHTHGIVGVDLTTGQTAWRLPLDKPLDRLFPLGEGFLGVGLLGGEVQIVRAKSGERVFTRRVAGTRRVVGGALIDGTLLIQHAAQRPQEAYQLLAALDIATGTELWRHDAILSLSLGGAPLGVVGGQVPTVVLPRPGDRRNRQAKLMMLDVRTGTETG
ncbi:MAG: PQQ-binding-like beta-propeller repeat protein, partial [Phycisphaerae bacterium]